MRGERLVRSGIERVRAHGKALAALMMALLLAACSTSDALQTTTPSASALDLSAAGKYAAVVVDGSNGQVLYSANASAPRYPASLTKMMTLYMLFEAMQQGRVTNATPIPVSAYAASRPPSKLGVRPGDSIPAISAIQALCTKSANDVAVAVAEYLGGSEEQFAAMMTTRARQLGMTGTTFQNASGLPDAGQRTTARDMALLGMALRQRFPSQYGYF
jgi:D-alanyl-D-alanine carboxypeptidase